MQKMRTLGEFILAKQHDFPHASGELSSLLASIRLAAKIVNREINKAGLADIIGASGHDNIQGEQQQKLDLYANETFKAALEARDQVCGVANSGLWRSPRLSCISACLFSLVQKYAAPGRNIFKKLSGLGQAFAQT